MMRPERPWFNWYAEGVDPRFTPVPQTVNDRMAHSFATWPDTVMIEYYGQEFTFAQMHGLVSQVARALKAAGIEKGDRIALHLPNCPWHPIFFFGALWAGAAVTHLSPLDAEQELAHKLTDSGAKLVISLTTPEFSGRFPRLLANGTCPTLYLCPDPVSAQGRDCPVIEGAHAVEDLLGGHSAAPMDAAPTTPEDLALLQYTGGTTGVPKAAQLTHSNLATASQMYSEMGKGEASQQPGKPALGYSPLFHIMGLSSGMIKRASEGGTLCLRLRFDAASAIDEIEKKGIVSLGGVPTTWIAILALPDIDKRDLSSLDYVASGGAPLPMEVYTRVKQLTGLKLRGGWGMTETSPAGTTVPRGMPDNKLGTIGIPVPGVDMKIVDVDDCEKDLAPGQSGEMVIKGPNVTAGYWNRSDEENAACYTRDGYFLTGDIGYMDEDGWFYIVDRKKDMILSGGFNVYPLTIENAIHQHPDVLEAMVIGVPDAYRGESAKAFVMLNPGAGAFTLEDLQAFLEDKLGRHEIPRHLEFRSELPRTAVGKASRKMLKEQELARAAEETA
ncbi:AMP-binding protein [Pseudooceanicola onchidii]|uniref:AMP-binding protein n=1 Tax=Pseudooceanicola onchidii TaxID=2562279 RepID=UPI00145B0E48|nr:AMP-binding protein [Pseudooceanicola onchidii]